ncbi:hypothetical protein ILYODFUR_017295 [Ilyodon furcidens]|uniref:Uncharacterized protein n=1 Tax=Ilyodon furcidens TaxID=33524 RepID=A0ABV0TVF9_9TELE
MQLPETSRDSAAALPFSQAPHHSSSTPAPIPGATEQHGRQDCFVCPSHCSSARDHFASDWARLQRNKQLLDFQSGQNSEGTVVVGCMLNWTSISVQTFLLF